MKRILSFIAIATMISVVACKSKEKDSTSIKRESKSGQKTLVVSFISKGSGIDSKAFKAVEEVLADTLQIDCSFEKRLVKYGREGERQFCLSFNDTRCFNKVYGAVNSTVGENERVQVVPNGTCRK